MKTIQEQIAVMQHFANGGKVEAQDIGGYWGTVCTPYWDWDNFDYRIKVEVDPYAELKAAAKDPTKQIKTKYCHGWSDAGRNWSWDLMPEEYEIRDKPKPRKKVKLLAWFTGDSIAWLEECKQPISYWCWKRVPSEDKIIEVEDD